MVRIDNKTEQQFTLGHESQSAGWQVQDGQVKAAEAASVTLANPYGERYDGRLHLQDEQQNRCEFAVQYKNNMMWHFQQQPSTDCDYHITTYYNSGTDTANIKITPR